MTRNSIVQKALKLSKVDETFMNFKQKEEFRKKCVNIMEEIIEKWENYTKKTSKTEIFDAVNILSTISYKTPTFLALEFKNKVRQRFIKDIKTHKNNLCDYLIEHSLSNNEEETLKALDLIQGIN